MSAESELATFVARFSPKMQSLLRGARAPMAARFPAAVQLVCDNYNFLVIGFGPTEKASGSIFSLAAYAHGLNLCFLQRGPELPDAAGLLRGGGKKVRRLVLTAPEDLDRPEVGALLEAALALAATPMEAATGPVVIVKSVSAKQRPRR